MSAFLWALLTAAIWGVVPLLEKLGLGSASPAVGVMVRSFGVVVGMLLFGWLWSPWSALRSVSWSSILLLGSGGLLASFVGQFAFYHALKSGAISQVTPVAGAYPLVAALLGWWVLREPLTMSRLLGVGLIVAGVFLLRK
ncbi:MAG: EamA family transporter [Candidatus Omnitrophica bacterium]|nr:EamA family transporter [Candidatus Omnitrophota bacterium]MBI2494972.1 EamA family transporter [Candidatus Omnitrophota bacterium]MBI3020698.1 EamA family transporter [Candidatus Omnitrophota bacterium]MBI3083730.1 EamA family transporter [Candidatus Omnitrophota bacterium]